MGVDCTALKLEYSDERGHLSISYGAWGLIADICKDFLSEEDLNGPYRAEGHTIVEDKVKKMRDRLKESIKIKCPYNITCGFQWELEAFKEFCEICGGIHVS